VNNVRAKIFLSRHLPPARIFILGFAGVILLGAFALWLPFSASKNPLTFIDALSCPHRESALQVLPPLTSAKISPHRSDHHNDSFQSVGLESSPFRFSVRHDGRGFPSRKGEFIQFRCSCTPRRDSGDLEIGPSFISYHESVGALLLFIRFSRISVESGSLHFPCTTPSRLQQLRLLLFSDSLMGYRRRLDRQPHDLDCLSWEEWVHRPT